MKKYIVDTTLRDGEQTPGVMFTAIQKMEIAYYLNQLGIDEVEVGTPAMGVSEQNIIREIATAGFLFRTISWCRALTLDIDLAELCKTDAVNISFPVSEIQLNALQKDENWVLEQIPILVKYALAKFKYVYVGMQDATRANRDFLIQAIATALNAGACRIRIADTVGIMNPVSTTGLFADLVNIFSHTDFEFHPHNDLGMATANAFSARVAGASGVSGTVNGIGERAGNVAIEELIMAEYMAVGNITKYNTHIIKKICSSVAEFSYLPLSKCKPIVGGNAFVHETGVHVRSVLKNKMSYQPYDESKVGVGESKVVIGKHSGKSAIEYFFKQNGKELTKTELLLIQERIKEALEHENIEPNENYIMDIYKNVMCSGISNA